MPFTKDQIQEILSEVKYGNMEFHVGQKDNTLFLQLRWNGVDTYTNAAERQHSRKWQLSEYMTKNEIIQTAFKACLTAEEHECRERFRYKNKSIFGPHFDVDTLAEICSKKENLDLRIHPEVKVA